MGQFFKSEKSKKQWHKTWWGLLILLCFFPFTISYWLWKRNWNILLKLGVIGFFWMFFLMFVSVSTYVSETPSDKSQVNQGTEVSTEKIGNNPTPMPTQTNEERQKELEEEKSRLAVEYCEQRKNSLRYYPLPAIQEVTDNQTEYELSKTLKKQGVNLTQKNCRSIIDYLYYMSEKYALTTDFNFQQVVERKYWVGMNMAELYTSLGYPNDINRTNYGSGETIQNVYYKDSYGSSAYYIYVDDGIVTSYQDF